MRSSGRQGSASRGDEDAWSDIDLALRLRPGVDPNEVAERWTELLSRDQAVVDQLDLWADGALYRVFLTASTLQMTSPSGPTTAFEPPDLRSASCSANP